MWYGLDNFYMMMLLISLFGNHNAGSSLIISRLAPLAKTSCPVRRLCVRILISISGHQSDATLNSQSPPPSFSHLILTIVAFIAKMSLAATVIAITTAWKTIPVKKSSCLNLWKDSPYTCSCPCFESENS